MKMSVGRCWNDTDRGKTEIRGRRKTCFSSTLSTTHIVSPDLGSKLGLHGERAVTNRLNHGTTYENEHKLYLYLKIQFVHTYIHTYTHTHTNIHTYIHTYLYTSKKCTNNQAEQLAILAALQYIETTQRTDQKITIYTDSKITLDKLQNTKIQTYIIEEIRRKIIEMNRTSWEVKLCWVAGILGNELADPNESLTEEYNRIPKSVVTRELEEDSVKKWQRNWTQTTKGSITKEYFPNVEERLKMKINLTQNFTVIVTGHGKTKAYLHRFKIIEEPTCSCGTAEQTTDHVIYECETLTKREKS